MGRESPGVDAVHLAGTGFLGLFAGGLAALVLDPVGGFIDCFLTSSLVVKRPVGLFRGIV